MRFLSSVFVAAMLVATQASAKPEVIQFSDLVDPLAVAFDDPYRDMGFRLLNELKLVVELDQKLTNDKLAPEERARLEARRVAAQEKLKANGQDVDALLSQRWIVAKKRQAARMATNPIFDGAEITLSGYLIPAPRAVDGSGFGYLVSQVGMCSHLPPPPPNQLVRVKLRADQGEPVSLCAGSDFGSAARGEKRCNHIYSRWKGTHAQRLDPRSQNHRLICCWKTAAELTFDIRPNKITRADGMTLHLEKRDLLTLGQ